jgi:hypothetical protein
MHSVNYYLLFPQKKILYLQKYEKCELQGRHELVLRIKIMKPKFINSGEGSKIVTRFLQYRKLRLFVC